MNGHLAQKEHKLPSSADPPALHWAFRHKTNPEVQHGDLPRSRPIFYQASHPCPPANRHRHRNENDRHNQLLDPLSHCIGANKTEMMSEIFQGHAPRQ